ncbi:hypothetical protein BKA83DRAFT_4426729 [Pisolithus microcarpus]|nr:hypothetical protein BKA83DRAFT_4426729 [Pisolithus microcarpus]
MFSAMKLTLRRGNITRIPPVRRRQSSTHTSSPNHDLIQLLARYKAEADASDARNPYKARAYERAIKVVAGMDEPVRSGSTSQKGGVGDRIAKRIDAFIANIPYDATACTKTTQNAERSCPSTDSVRSQYIINSLQLIPGIGKKRAETLFQKGCTSLSDLLKPEYFDLLTPAQQVCARFTSCLNPVTLEEAESVHRFVSENISSKYEVILVGDHRRSQPSSNEVILLIVHPFETELKPPKSPYDAAQKPAKLRPAQFYALGDTFVHRGLVVTSIAGGPRRWRGIVRVPARVGCGEWEGRGERLSQINNQEGLYRRLGIFFVPKRCQGAARIVLTGDVKFVEDIYSRAHRLGLRFDEYGLWKWIEGEGKWEFLCGENEELIFREFRMDYVHPARRNFTYLLGERPRGQPKKIGVDDQSTISAGSGQYGKELVEPARPGSRKRGRPRKMPPQE